MSLKSALKQLFNWIQKVFNKMDTETKVLVPVAISITNGVKQFVDSQVGEFSLELIKKAIPGDVDDVLIDKVHAWIDEKLPDVILKLKLVESVSNIENPADKLIAVLNFLKTTDVSEKTNYWIGLSAVILETLKDGKITLAEATVIIQSYYHGKIN